MVGSSLAKEFKGQAGKPISLVHPEAWMHTNTELSLGKLCLPCNFGNFSDLMYYDIQNDIPIFSQPSLLGRLSCRTQSCSPSHGKSANPYPAGGLTETLLTHPICPKPYHILAGLDSDTSWYINININHYKSWVTLCWSSWFQDASRWLWLSQSLNIDQGFTTLSHYFLLRLIVG